MRPLKALFLSRPFLFLLLCFVTALVCTPASRRPVKEPIKLSIRDQAVVAWIEQDYFDSTRRKRRMPEGEALRILLANRTSSRRHFHWKWAGCIENTALCMQHRESGMLKTAIGLYDKKKDSPNKSRGLMQVMDDVAAMRHGKRIDPNELCQNIELNVELGIGHLMAVGTLQRYNAGPNGAKAGRGRSYPRRVNETLQGLPWVVKKSKGAKQNETIYDRLFVVIGPAVHGHSHGGRGEARHAQGHKLGHAASQGRREGANTRPGDGYRGSHW